MASSHLPLLLLALFPALALAQFDGQEMGAAIGANPFAKFIRELGGPKEAKEFLKLTTNPDLTNAQLAEQLEEFAEQNGVTSALKKLNETANRMKEEIVEAAPENLAGPALATFNQVIEILSDESQTRGQQCDQVRSVLNGTDPVVRHFLPKGLGISCLGVGNDPFAEQIKSKFGQIGANIGKFFGLPAGQQ